jgi:hypothetical protein
MEIVMDRYSIVEGYFWYFVNYHGGQCSEEYRRLCRIQKYFNPSPLSSGPETEGGQEVYDNLVMKYENPN